MTTQPTAPLAEQLQRVCHHPLPWLIFFSLGYRPIDRYRSSCRLAVVKMARRVCDVRRGGGMEAARGRSRRLNAIEAVTGALNLKALFVRSTAFVLAALAAASFVDRANAFVYWTESPRGTIGRANQATKLCACWWTLNRADPTHRIRR
jgi:hypothetical protein